jgi:hypothetical protein
VYKKEQQTTELLNLAAEDPASCQSKRRSKYTPLQFVNDEVKC